MSKVKQQPQIAKLQSTFGITECATGSLHQVGGDVIAYLSGFQIVFFDYIKNQILNTINLGENILKVNCIEFYNSFSAFLSCEDRPEGATISLYNRTENFQYTLQNRIVLMAQIGGQQQTIQSVLLAKFISSTKLAVITGATKYMFLVYENDQKTAVMPTYSLKIQQEGIIDGEVDCLKMLQLSDKELLLIAGQSLKTIRLQQSITKILPPNNFLNLTRRYTFTDGIYINRYLKKRYPDIPLDSDQLVVLSTREGVLVVMLKTTIVKEIQLPFIKEISSLQFLTDPTGQQFTVQQADDSQKNFIFFTQCHEQLQQKELNHQENSSGFLFVLGGQNAHVFGLRCSEFFRFVSKNFYGGQTNWEKYLDVDKMWIHLLSYNTAIVVDQALGRVNGYLGLRQAITGKTEQHMISYCCSETSKMLVGFQLSLFMKRIGELDRMQMASAQANTNFRYEVETQLSGAGQDLKKLIAQDQLTQIKGEIVRLDSMEVNVTAMNFLGNTEDDVNDVTQAYDQERSRELWLLQPVYSSAALSSLSVPSTLNRLFMFTKDRVLRIFNQQSFTELTFTKFPDVARQCVVHPNGKFCVLCGTDFVDVYQVQYDKVDMINRFTISFCNVCVFSPGGELMLLQSGQHMYVIDFFNLRELYVDKEFQGRILGMSSLYRDDVPAEFQYNIFVWSQDGTITLYDLSAQKRIGSFQFRNKFVRAATASSQLLTEDPLLFCILNDDSLVVLDKNCKQLGDIPLVEQQLTQQVPALNVQQITGAASNDVICSVNDGEINLQKVFRGSPSNIINIGPYIIISYSLPTNPCSYVLIKNVGQTIQAMLKGQKPAKEREQLIAINRSPAISLVPTFDGKGFVLGCDDGLLFNFQLTDIQEFLQKSERQPLKIQENEQKFAEVQYAQLMTVDKEIDELKQKIYKTKLQTTTTKQHLNTEFQKDMDILVNQTTEMTSQQQSEQARLKTEHENKTILLKRQIANNEALFRTSKQALEAQYTKRLVFMNDEVTKLKQTEQRANEQLETDFAIEKQTLEQRLRDENEQRDGEIGVLKAEVQGLRLRAEQMQVENELFYKESENELYMEAQQQQAAFHQKQIDLELETEQVKKVHTDVKEEYNVLEHQLQDNQKRITEKNLQIQELRQSITNMKRDIEVDKQEIVQHELTLQQREKRIQELDQKIRELNKISFILQFKIRELERTIKPKEQELEELKTKLTEMNKELANYRTNLATLLTSKKELSSKNLSLKQQVQNVAESERETLKKLAEIRSEINKMVALIAEQEAEYKRIVTAGKASEMIDRNIQYRQLVNQLKKIQETLDKKPNYLMQKKQKEEEEGNFSKLEQNVVKLQIKLNKQKSSTKSSTSGVMAQNAHLMQEINQLRRELHQAMVQANSNCQIDEGLMKLYEQNRAVIQNLRQQIRQREKQAQTAGFLPDLQ